MPTLTSPSQLNSANRKRGHSEASLSPQQNTRRPRVVMVSVTPQRSPAKNWDDSPAHLHQVTGSSVDASHFHSTPPYHGSQNYRNCEDSGSRIWMRRFHDASTESAATTRATQLEDGEGAEQQKDRAYTPPSGTGENIILVSDRRTPSSSTTDRQDQIHPLWTYSSGDTPADSGDPATDTLQDSDWNDEGYISSNRTSFATSVASEVNNLITENGRHYPNYGRHPYGLPVDEEEEKRMAVQHEKYRLLLNNNLFLAPVGNCPQKILDLATGTGEWVVDIADAFPTAEVTGVDVALIMPTWVPPNCRFEIGDVEASWKMTPDSFDFIHMRDPLFVVRDWKKLVHQCFEHLKPGGWCELACTYLAPVSKGGRMPDSSGFRLGCEMLMKASTVFGTPLDCPLYFAHYLCEAGFIAVTERKFQIPSCPWPEDERQVEIGRLEERNLSVGASAFGLRVFKHSFGWTRADTELEMMNFRRDSANRDYQQYCPYFVVYGQKPPSSGES